MLKKSLIIPALLAIMVASACKDKTGVMSLYDQLPDANFPCTNGLAADLYECNNVSLYAHLTPEELGGQQANDIWGWQDPLTQKEYALVGLNDGVSFVDITDPNNPVVVGKLAESNMKAKYKPMAQDDFPACTIGVGDSYAAKGLMMGSTWRDMKVYDNHIYVVSDGQIHGMQVFDLTKLRDYSGSFMNFEQDGLYEELGNAHNIAINQATGFAYVVGVTTAERCGSRSETGLHMIDLNDPANPQFAGCYFDADTEIPNSINVGTGYIHDTECIVYDGPDTEHAGEEVCFSSAEGAVVITDVSDKTNPATISVSGHEDMQYSHQGWLTEDRAYFLMNDELDEWNLGRETKTYVWDVKDLDNPTFAGYYTHNTPTIGHNLYIRNNFVFQTNYTSGIRILKTGDLSKAELKPAGFFDTQPESNEVEFEGTWSNYPYFESGVLIASDIYDGLFILKPEI